MNLYVAAFALLMGTTASAFAQSTPVPPEHRELVQELLEDSLTHELKRIEQRKDTHYGTREEYWKQFNLRGRVGEVEQSKKLAGAILDKHEERNLDRSTAYYDRINSRYIDPTSSAAGLSDMIRMGKSDQVLAILRERSQTPVSEKSPGFATENFWIACKLAVAFHQANDADKVRSSLNLARRIRENTKATGLEFDTDDQWLPKLPESRNGWGTGRDQSRATFYAALIQSGHSELAIEWFLKRSSNPQVPEHNVWSSYFENTPKFIGQVARHVSARRASEIARIVFGDDIPAETHSAVISGGLARGELIAVASQVQQAVEGLERPTAQWGWGYIRILDSLVENNQRTLARVLLDGIVERLEGHVQQRVTADNIPLAGSLWNDALRAYLAQAAVQIDKDAATKIVRLAEKNPLSAYEHSGGKRSFSWLMSVVKVQCGIATDLDRHRLLHGEAASVLIESYLADARLDLARDALRHASNEVRQTTTSGASIGGHGLAVMGNNPHNRILLARQAISLGNFDLARNLMDEIPFDPSRREGYRDITKRIAKEHGLEKARSWLESIEDGISRSGGNLGLVEFLVPEPEPMDIPRPWSASC